MGCNSLHSNPDKGSILIVDDEQIVRATYCYAFERAGYKVFHAESGKNVPSILLSENIGTVLLDVFMPGADGLETLMAIKKLTPETAVIVMSGGSSRVDYLNVALKLGADAVVRKPVAPSVLLENLENLTRSSCASVKVDNRKYKRLKINLPGRLFDPADSHTIECNVLNLSAGGAMIECAAGYPLDYRLVLYIDHFGRFQGAVAHRISNLIGLKFTLGEEKRNRLRMALAQYAELGVCGVTQLRKSNRARSDDSVSLIFQTGEEATCEIVDISPHGISLRTQRRPPIGEIVCVGRTSGRVVRHHADGVAMQYIDTILPSEQ